MAAIYFIGTWEITGYGCTHGTQSESSRLEGVRFRLDETGDVIWTVPDEDKSVPLFNCETYELYTLERPCDPYGGVFAEIRFGAFDGHIIEFTSDVVPDDTMILTCEGWCRLHCKRIKEEPTENAVNAPFSLLPALEDGYFSDLKISAANNKQFKVHSSILQLNGSDLAWQSLPPPFTGLPEDVLGSILHYLYCECLPESLVEVTARQVITAVTPYPCLGKLVNMCQLFLKNMALKQQIIGLVSDMHACANQIIEYFNNRNQSVSDSITSNPAKLCFVVKQSVREAAVAGAKLLLLCDLFTKRKNELSREERHEIIRYAKSRLPVFMSQLHRFLQGVKSTFGSMSSKQRHEVATYLVPEIEVILDTISTLIVEIEKALQQIIQLLSPNDSARVKTGMTDVLGKSLRNVLHIRELTKLRNFHEHITCSLGLLLHKKENFYEMSPAQKVRSVARNLEQLIEELPFFLLRLEEVTAALDDKLEWREFKFCFKVGTSKVSGVLQKLESHRNMLQDVMTQVCDLVQRDAFTQSLHMLGLLEFSSLPSQASECQRLPRTSSISTPKHTSYKLNLVESLCVSPAALSSTLSKLSLQLLKSGIGTDMEFEVVVAQDTQAEQTVLEHSGEQKSCTDTERHTIRAHRVIVAARCDWFRRALLSGMREAIDRKIVIHDTNPFLFRAFLEYLYSGRLRQASLTTDQLAELLLLSDRYEVDSLKQACEHSLHSSIDEDSVLYFLSMADQFNARVLRNSCLSFISHHQDLTESELFYELPIALQAEIFDCVWTQPATNKKVDPGGGRTRDVLPPVYPLRTRNSSDLELVNLQHDTSNLHLDSAEYSSSSPLEEFPLSQDSGRLEAFISQLRDVIGDGAPRERLVQISLAADFDITRAINFFYAKDEE